MTCRRRLVVLLMFAAGAFVGCHRRNPSEQQPQPTQTSSLPDSCTLALAPQGGASPQGGAAQRGGGGTKTGASKIDEAIARLQESARTSPKSADTLNDLGQYFIAKARITHDVTYYQRAEASARCAEAREPGNAQALLLRGHILHQEHRFKEAEPLAHQLVATRGLFLDYGLLGDVLLEQGKVDEAGAAYQHMMDLKPFYHSYTRAAHLRWLKGDLPGATSLIRMAVKSASPRDPEAVAWAYARLALYELQAGRLAEALDACDAALASQPDYAAALLVRGRTLLASKQPTEAVRALEKAAAADPVPEYQWTLAEALGAAGRTDDARAAEAAIQAAASVDPRTVSLYLATRHTQVDAALGLARRELDTRADVFTLDALAWSLAAAGHAKEADETMQRALSEGTRDARLFYHAGVIAASVGDRVRARRWLRKALTLQQMLLPSEQAHVADVLAGRTVT